MLSFVFHQLNSYCKIWYFVVNSNVGKNLFSFVYISTSPSRRNEYQVKHILGRMIKSWLWSWLAPPWHQLGKFLHATWSRQAAMILRTSTRLFSKGLNIKGQMLLKGLSKFEIHWNWTQACLIYIVWSIFLVLIKVFCHTLIYLSPGSNKSVLNWTQVCQLLCYSI